jgi:hypothetical protein
MPGKTIGKALELAHRPRERASCQENVAYMFAKVRRSRVPGRAPA